MTQAHRHQSRVLRSLRARRASESSRVQAVAAPGATRITHINPVQVAKANQVGTTSAGAHGGLIAIELAAVSAGGGAEAPFRNPLAPIAPERVLLPVIGVNDELLPAFERTLEPVVRRAWSGDRAARDALYAAFEPKLMRFARRIHVPFAPAGATTIWDRGDVAQEVYLAFVDVIATWTPPIPFGRYVLAHFPWRLRDVVYRGVARTGIPPSGTVVAMERIDRLGDDSASAAESRVLLESIAASFAAPYDDILRWHIGDGESLMTIAGRLGCSRRTATRRWRVILDRLRVEFDEADRGHA